MGLISLLIRPLRFTAPYFFFCPTLASIVSFIASWGLAILGETLHLNALAGLGFFVGYLYGALGGAALGFLIASMIRKRPRS